MAKTFEESFLKYDHYFDFVLELVKEIRRLKGDANVGSKTIDATYINIRNSEYKLALVLECAGNIARLCKTNTLYINYFDDEKESNNLNFKFDKNKSGELQYLCRTLQQPTQ